MYFLLKIVKFPLTILVFGSVSTTCEAGRSIADPPPPGSSRMISSDLAVDDIAHHPAATDRFRQRFDGENVGDGGDGRLTIGGFGRKQL